MSVNAKNFNVKVPTKVNTRAELCDKKSIFGSLCVLRTEVWGLGTQLVMQICSERGSMGPENNGNNDSSLDMDTDRWTQKWI